MSNLTWRLYTERFRVDPPFWADCLKSFKTFSEFPSVPCAQFQYEASQGRDRFAQRFETYDQWGSRSS